MTHMAMADEGKRIASEAISGREEDLLRISEEIWKNPELAFEEHAAHSLLTEFLDREGFAVDKGYMDVGTAFRARFGSGKPNVCVICEYDALPDIGHACGHNLIAEAGIAAGLGIKAFLDTTKQRGTVTVMGTPAEEGGGGKVMLLERNGFEDVDIAMMVHPTPFDMVSIPSIACSQISVHFKGLAAHAAAFPWEGINALDAAIMAYNSVSALRQQMKPAWRVHGVITDGGIKPNIIPESSSMEYYIRAPNSVEVEVLRKKVVACFKAAAQSTGCEVEIQREGHDYDDVLSNPLLAKLYEKNVRDLGIDPVEQAAAGSTDMGNVSYAIPSIHPFFSIGSGKEVNHTREFTAVANTVEAHGRTLIAAKAMTYTCIDVITGGDRVVEEIRSVFKS